MRAMNAWASGPTDSGAIGVARPSRVRPIAAASIGAMMVAIGLPLTAMSASAVVATPNAIVTVFPATDTIVANGYVAGSTHTVNVVRQGFTVGTSQATADLAGDIMINHPPAAGGTANCWVGVTPGLRSNDVIQVLNGANTDATTTAGVTLTQTATVVGTDVTLKGTAPGATAGTRLPIGQLQVRVNAKNTKFLVNGTPSLRFPGEPGATLTYDSVDPAISTWTATFTGLGGTNPDIKQNPLGLTDANMAAQAPSHQVRSVPVLSEVTIVDVGPGPVAPKVAGPVAPCTAPAAVGPSKPTMSAATDLGASTTDGLTNNPSPTFGGVPDLATSTRVDLFVDGAATPSGTAPVVAGAPYSIPLTTPLTAGTHTITAKEFSATGTATAGNVPASATIDLTPATMTASLPAANAKGTRLSGNVTATFDEAVHNIDATTVTLTSAAGAVSASRSVGPLSKVITLDPVANLAFNTTYTATLTGAITDMAGNPVAAKTWTFTTAPSLVASYINRVYLDLFNRAPDPTGIAGWTAKINTGTPRVAVANGITLSTENRTKLITGSYDKYLHRAPDAGGLKANLAAMGRGMTISKMEAGFIGSAEYYIKAGGTNSLWVNKLYTDVLARPASSGEVGAWNTRLSAGEPRSKVSMGFLISKERLATVVEGYYQQLLGRGLDPTGKAGWVNKLQLGGFNETIIGGIIASDEYWLSN